MNGQGAGQGAILDTSYRLVDSSNFASAGATILQIYCTGLGAVTYQPLTGSPPLTNQLSQTALVPASSAKGAAVPVVIAIGGATSNTVTIAVQ